jgi:hypothetical protein
VIDAGLGGGIGDRGRRLAGANRFWLKRCNSSTKDGLDGCAVPPIDGLRAHQDEGRHPARPDPTSQNPEHLVDRGHPRCEVTPLQDQWLLPEDTVFQEKIALAAKQTASKAGDQPEKVKQE